MNLKQCIAAAEADPAWRWLARKLGPADEAEFGDGYLVNIYREDAAGDLERYIASGSKLEYAFRGALAAKESRIVYLPPAASQGNRS